MKGLQQEQESNPSKCNICNDDGMIYVTNNTGNLQARRCKCKLMEDAKNRMNNSGLGNLLETKTMDNFTITSGFQKAMKDNAIEYVEEFIKGNKYSFAILGQSGIGKTHLLSAVARQLLDNNIGVKYYIADEITQVLQACKYDTENYMREFSKIANAEVLYIDDLFKTSITNYYKEENIKLDDFKDIFQIINYRNNKGLPILLSSEIHFERFIDIDQAIVGRINEMCNYKYLVSIKPDTNKNYRLNKRG